MNDPAQLEFWKGLRGLCGQSFAGELVTATAADRALEGQRLTLDVWQCFHREIRLAFHVGDDHSRVWLVTSTQDALRLAHSLHDSTGATLRFSGYGGNTQESGTTERQVFHPDPNTLTQVPSAAGAVWVLELIPRDHLTYSLESSGRTTFRVDFHLRKRVGRPHAPWGFTRVRGGLSADTVNSRNP